MERPTGKSPLLNAFFVGSILVTLGLLIVLQPFLSSSDRTSDELASEIPEVAVTRSDPAATLPLPAPLPDTALETFPSREEIDRMVREAVEDAQPVQAAPQPAIKAKDTPLRLPGKSTIYTVKKGDTLGSIASAHYGDFTAFADIYEANRTTLKGPGRLTIGQTLILPPDLGRKLRPRARPNGQ